MDVRGTPAHDENARPIAACNCGGWHGGNASERLRELTEVLSVAGCEPIDDFTAHVLKTLGLWRAAAKVKREPVTIEVLPEEAQPPCSTPPLSDSEREELERRATREADETPLDEAWLKSVGFIEGWKDWSGDCFVLRNLNPEPITGDLVIYKRARYTVTRGQVRLICRGMGIELKEPSEC
jgi:hypothetical protein